MCIRDRFISNIEIFDSFYIDDNFYIITLKDDLKTPNIFEICLLYTSDAADERSSVDLGGRRIIKKKNRVYNGGSAIIKKKNNNYTIKKHNK